MANAAIARVPEYAPVNAVPKTASERAAAASADGTGENNVTTALKTITTYVPTETLTLYVAVIAALPRIENTTQIAMDWLVATFVFFLLFTPAAIWVAYAAKLRANGKPFPKTMRSWPVWEMIAGTIAYVAWSIGLSDSPFSTIIPLALGGVIVLVTSTILGLIAGLFQKPLQSP